MFDLLELILEVLPDLVSLAKDVGEVRETDAAFDRRLVVFGVATMAQQQHLTQRKDASCERGVGE